VERPRFLALPGTAGVFHAAMLRRALVPLLDRLFAERPFDVIDASFFFPDGPAAVALGRRYGVPVSVKARGADIHHWGRASATRAQVRAAGRGAAGLLAVSAAMARDMVALGLPSPRVHHTGVDLDAFVPGDRAAAKCAVGIDGPLVVSVGALIPRKGHDIVVDAVAALPGVTLAIAGEGPLHDMLAARAKALGIAARVRLLGSVPHAELPRWLAAADAMALASTSEGLANAWIEALACGTPIVIPDAGGAREVVLDDDAGRIVEREPVAVRAALAALLAVPPAPDAVRRHAERFTWAANTAALYAHLAALTGRLPVSDDAEATVAAIPREMLPQPL
jgi:glycosyltransferase involved in cell wall biosynthesis